MRRKAKSEGGRENYSRLSPRNRYMMSASVSLPDLMRAPPSRAAFARSALVACSLRILRRGVLETACFGEARRTHRSSMVLSTVIL